MTGKLQLEQGETGYRYNRDSFLLADFFRADDLCQVIDLGAGSGAVSIPIAFHNRGLNLTALEIDEKAAKLSEVNATKSGLKNYRVIVGDILDAKSIFKNKCFDAVVSNPPYKKAGSGRLSPDMGKATARNEIKITLKQLVEISSEILCKQGSLSITMAAERRDEYKKILADNDFYEARYLEVLALPGSEPIIFISEASLGSGRPLTILPPLALRSPDGGDSDEYCRITSRYA